MKSRCDISNTSDFSLVMFLTCWINKQHIQSVLWWIFIFSKIILCFWYIYETLSCVTVKQWTTAWRPLSQTYVKTIKTAIPQSPFLRILSLSIYSSFTPNSHVIHFFITSVWPHTLLCVPSKHTPTHKRDYIQWWSFKWKKGETCRWSFSDSDQSEKKVNKQNIMISYGVFYEPIAYKLHHYLR